MVLTFEALRHEWNSDHLNWHQKRRGSISGRPLCYNIVMTSARRAICHS